MMPPGAKDSAALEALYLELCEQHKRELEDPATRAVAEQKIQRRLEQFIDNMDHSSTVDPGGFVVW